MGLRVRVPALVVTGVALADKLMGDILGALRAIVADTRRDVVIRGVPLPDAVEVTVPHGLGYGYEHVSVSPPVGGSTTGRIQIVGPINGAQHVMLLATGWGATVTVDLRIT